MANDEKSFEELVEEAPLAPVPTVSLVGKLAKSSEAGKFVLTLADGSAMTLETAAVKEHQVLGSSVGHTIVRVDVDAAAITPPPAPVPPTPVPFVLATAHQAPDPVLDAMTRAWMANSGRYTHSARPQTLAAAVGTGYPDPGGVNTGYPDPGAPTGYPDPGGVNTGYPDPGAPTGYPDPQGFWAGTGYADAAYSGYPDPPEGHKTGIYDPDL